MTVDWARQTPSISAATQPSPALLSPYSWRANDGQIWAQITAAARASCPGPIHHLQTQPVIISKAPRKQSGAESASAVYPPPPPPHPEEIPGSSTPRRVNTNIKSPITPETRHLLAVKKGGATGRPNDRRAREIQPVVSAAHLR